jgi:hypothetical protein
MGLTQGGAPCGRLPWAILGRAFGAENQRPQKIADPFLPLTKPTYAFQTT